MIVAEGSRNGESFGISNDECPNVSRRVGSFHPSCGKAILMDKVCVCCGVYVVVCVCM